MCTVSFIPVHDKIFITHNRDEKAARLKAIPPKMYTINGHDLLFPRDSEAGGTWIAMDTMGNAAVLLNGASEKHVPRPPYLKSRGLAFLDIVATDDAYNGWQQTGLKGIEPFTLILFSRGNLMECRWNGKEKQDTMLNTTACHTWSSVTLYDEITIGKRQAWFQSWLKQHTQPNATAIIQYHLSAGEGDPTTSLKMNRKGELLTVSLTCMEIFPDKGKMRYHDLQEQLQFEKEIAFTKIAATP